MNVKRLSIAIFIAAYSLAACIGVETVVTPPPTTATQSDPMYPAYPEVLDTAQVTAYPGPAETGAADVSPTADQLTPASQTPALIIPASIYPCNLQGTRLPVWRSTVVQTFPHDNNAYTQGMIIRDGVLYEGTGLRGRSTLRKVALETGQVLQSIDLPQQFFGEGIVELDGKLYQITWQERTGFIYDFATFEKVGEFNYATEGWGLTQDGQQLVMSDGTDQLYFIDPASMKVSGQVQVTDDRGPVLRINELEYVAGEVWGNIYQTACIARIDPKNGKVTGWIDLTGLHDLALQASQAPIPPEVPNGIAYDPASKRIFVTGKFWPTLYEISLTPVEAQP